MAELFEPDEVMDGVEYWNVGDGLDVARDNTGFDGPTLRVGEIEVSARRAQLLRDALHAALTPGRHRSESW